MPIQNATIGNMAYATNLLIGEIRYTAEHNSPCIHLIERHKLAKGEYKKRFPKLGSVDMSALTDGEDLIDSLSFGLTYVDAEPTEVGGKFIITDKLSREETFDVMKAAGKQLGDSMGRKRDEDIIALFVNLDNAFGATAKYLSLANASSVVANVRDLKFPRPISAVVHPAMLGYLAISGAVLRAAVAGMPEAFSTPILQNFWTGISMDAVPFFEDGNIPEISGDTTGYGAIFSKSCMGIVEELAPSVKMETDISMRATEVVIVADYVAVEIDGTYGGSMRYYTSALATNA